MAKQKRDRNAVPKYRLHKARNQAAVTIDGKHHYLGPYNSPESRELYRQLIAKYLASKDKSLPPLPTEASDYLGVNIVIEQYLAEVQTRYQLPDGTATSEQTCITLALAPLSECFGVSNIHEFGPKKLKEVRTLMVSKGWSRSTINKSIQRIKRMFRWATEEELIDSSIIHGLDAVRGLQRGRTEARETKPVEPVDDKLVEATLPFVASPVAGLIRLMRLTGMRPGEATALRWQDIDTSESPWSYRPMHHKNSWRGQDRVIHFGPQARKILETYQKKSPTVFIFSPRDAMIEKGKQRRATRKSPLTPSQRQRRPKPAGKRRPSERYTTSSLRKAAGYCQQRNTPFQGLAADGAKLALWYLWRNGFRIVNFIHDEVLIEVREGTDLSEAAREVNRLMVQAMQEVVPDITIKVECSTGSNWGEMAPLDPPQPTVAVLSLAA